MKFDLHVHTMFSDGISSPEDIVKKAKEIKLDGLAITDHDNVKGLKRAEKAAKDAGIIFIPGVEITTPMGDIIALNIKEMPKIGKNTTPLEIIDFVHSGNGIAVLAHPFGGYWPVSFAEIIDVFKGKFDAVEIFNACTPLEANIAAMELAKKMKFVGVAGSDAHTADKVGAAFTVSSSDDILSEIKKGNVKVGWL